MFVFFSVTSVKHLLILQELYISILYLEENDSKLPILWLISAPLVLKDLPIPSVSVNVEKGVEF